MSPQFDEVLLTAYLDDEVTDEERARVVEELRTSEASRKLLEELRSVRDLVAQLHLSPPSRRFEQGPWNAKALHEANVVSGPMDEPRVILNEARWYLKMPFQRVASLAALIAIAIFASVLMMGPKTKSISQSGGTTTDKSVDAKSSETFGNVVQLETTEAEDLIAQQPKVVGGATAMARSRDEAKSDFASTLLNESGFQPKEALARGGSGEKPQPQDVRLATEYDSKSRQSGKPANQPFAAPSPAISKPRTASESSGLGNELAGVTDSRADFSLQIVEANEELDRSKTPESNEFSNRFLYRFEVNKIEKDETRKLTETSDALGKELQLQKSNSIVLGKKKSIDGNGIEMKSILVEFQIPVENWELGAKRLRVLGMDIPEKLPTADFLEFTATPNELTTVLPLDQLLVDLREAKDTVASNWRFSVVAQKEKSVNRESETRAKEPAGKEEKKKQESSSSSAIQIRVRPIK